VLRFTKRADYGLMAIHYIATQKHAVSAKRIAEQYAIPPELMAKILQRLAKRGLIASHNGPKGGYELARDPGEISVGEVLRAIEGPLRIVSCMTGEEDCPQFSRCNLRRPVEKIQASISTLLDTMTLSALVAEPTAMVAGPVATLAATR